MKVPEGRAERAAYLEYDRWEGTPVSEGRMRLWRGNGYAYVNAVVIDVGRRPAVAPNNVIDTALRMPTAKQAKRMAPPKAAKRATPPKAPVVPEARSLALRLYAWMRATGVASQVQAAAALEITCAQAKHLLASNQHLFRPYRRIGPHIYYTAI